MDNKPRRKFFDTFIGIFILATIIVVIAGSILVSKDAMPFLTDQNVRYITFAYTLRIIEVLIMLIIFSIIKRTRFLLDSFNLKNNKLIPGLLLGILLNGICVSFALLHKDLTLSLNSINIGLLVYALISVGIQSASEEILTRLYIFKMIRRTYENPWVAIITNSVFFALCHVFNDGVTITAIISVFAISIFLSILVYLYDDIWIAIGVHTGWNFTQAFILGLPNSGESSVYSVYKVTNSTSSIFYNKIFGIEDAIPTIIVLIVSSVLFWFLSKKNKKAT